MGDAPFHLGRYTLFGEIAAGGMATVHFGRLAGEAGFAKTVAIKRLHPQYARDPDFREMFTGEARLAARVRHPNVVQTLDVVATDGELFLVMEYVHGESLSRLLRTLRAKKEPVSPKIAGAILAGVLHGLHAAHEAKSDQGEPLRIIHRDVSPQNVLVGTDGAPRVLDFGIAKAKDSVNVTRDGELRGKLPYMAPEQLGSTPITRRVDVYAASVVLWEMLAGRRLFEGDDDRVVYGRVLGGAHEPPGRFAPDVPRELDEIAMRGLALDPELRFATAREMALAIEEAAPLATASQVGAWVERVAREPLALRALRLSTVERAPSSATELEPPAPPAPAPLAIAPPSGAGPSPPSPSATPPAITPPKETPKKRGVDLVFAVAVLAILGVGGYIGVPLLVSGTLESRARAHGLTLTIERLETSPRKLRLHGVALTAADVPGVRIDAKNVELALRDFAIETITADEVDVTVDGALAPTLATLERFRVGRSLGLEPPMRALVGENVRLAWKQPFGDGTRAVAENVRADIVRRDPHALGEDVTLDVGIVKLETPAGTLGPYGGKVERDPETLHASLRLDSTGAAIVQGKLAKDGTGAIEFDSPPLAPADLGVPAAFAVAQKIAGTARWAAPTKGRVDAKIDLTFTGLRVSGQSAEVRIEAEVLGDARAPLRLAGAAVTLDGVRAPATGTIDLADGLRIDGSFSGPRRPCVIGDPAQLAGVFFVDTRHLEQTRAQTTSLGKCGAKRGTP